MACVGSFMICSDKNCHCIVDAIVYLKKKQSCQILSTDCVFISEIVWHVLVVS